MVKKKILPLREWERFSFWFFAVMFAYTALEIFLKINFNASITEFLNSLFNIELWGIYSIAIVFSFILFVCALVSLLVTFFLNRVKKKW